MRSQRFCLVATLIFAAVLGAAAQSNALVDELLAQEPARVDYAAYLALAAGGAVPETASPAEALEAARAKGWLPAARAGEEPLRLDEYSALVMRSLGLKGGLLFSLFPGPRYAYRELAYRGVVNDSGGPKRRIPGDEALRILRLAMELKGGTR
ncbi:MAG: hypothetical protein JNG85_01935 [Spirochaetaceae bacterium]|nr:hypothetical protein [Spirochaetaceae bacterium]